MSNVKAAGDVAQCLAQVAALDRLALLMRGELWLAHETLPVRALADTMRPAMRVATGWTTPIRTGVGGECRR